MTKVEYLNPDYPILVHDSGVKIEIYRSTSDNAVVVQIDTPEDSDVHEDIRVYCNEALADWR